MCGVLSFKAVLKTRSSTTHETRTEVMEDMIDTNYRYKMNISN